MYTKALTRHAFRRKIHIVLLRSLSFMGHLSNVDGPEQVEWVFINIDIERRLGDVVAHDSSF